MRGMRLNTKRPEALAALKQLVRHEEKAGNRRRVVYHLEYPNGGGVPIPSNELYATILQRDPLSVQWDCVGAAMTFLGCDRVQAPPWKYYYDKRLGYGYVNCNSMIKDALGEQILFEDATKTEEGPIAGDLVAFGGIGLVGTGHVGVLAGNGLVIHCSPRNAKKLGHALAETSPEVFLRHRGRSPWLGGVMWLRYKHWAG